jgi:hypothetical protein
MHHLDARQDDAGATKVLEAHHGFDDAFDGTMVLFNKVVQILVLPDFDGRFRSALIALRAARLAPLLCTVTVSGAPFWSMAFSK